jgi:hypothetical protein
MASHPLDWLMIAVRPVWQIPSKIAVGGPVLLLTELIVGRGGDSAKADNAKGSTLTRGTFASVERHTKLLF